MSEIKNGRLGLYGAEHSKCNMMTPGFKGLSHVGLRVAYNYYSRWLGLQLGIVD